MLRFVVDHYAEIRDEWVPRLQDRCRKMFDLATIIPEFMGWLTQLHEQRLAGLKAASRPLREVIQAAYEDLPDEFGLEEFYAAIKANATALDVTNQKTESRATSPWLCVDVLRHLHPSLVDTGDLHVRFRVSE